ncbi:uncharacterized protein LOC141637940 [Silene latifolia]|uniref:uncharacterized protein LOC141637940 n=1 Tax=Silene latifolia TaxID=37657 RepID=UPI003D7828E5
MRYRFHDCRYISASEAVWRIFGFEIHYRTPPVERLRFHLPDEQSVVFNDEDPIDAVIDNPTIGMTKFLAWMDCNKSSEEAQQLLYSQFPTKFVWKKEERAWHPRKNGFAIGRMHNVSPNCGELYYMRTLLNFVKGPKSYEDLRWFDDTLHPTFRAACYARGLLGDDKEYIDAIEEASRWGSGAYLRYLFVTLLMSSAIAMPTLRLTEDELKNYALLDIEACLQRNGSSLRRFEDMPFPESSTPHPTPFTHPSTINYRIPSIFGEAILAPTHEIVELVNDYILSRIPETEKIYFISDEVSKDETNIGVRDLYSTEFLNSIKCSGLPNHELKLKVGAIVMLLRNIDQSRGLCNGTRLIVTDLGSRVIRATTDYIG